MTDLAGKVALVTGGSRGIGEAIAATLAAHGADIALVARTSGALAETAERIGHRTSRRVVSFPCDLRELANVRALVSHVVETFGRIDILVNNAGATKHGNLLEREDADWLDAYDAKIHGFVRVTRECWPHLKAARGSIVNIGGVLAHAPNPNALIGSTLAAAVASLTKALAEFGRGDGITVNGVNPGLIETDRFRQHLTELGRRRDLSVEAEKAALLQRLGIDRLGRAQDVADVVALLLSNRTAYIRGAMIDVDGGMTKSL
jgi:NAD(P)-dependent dehydrogenase (short-subunit alcohol dehydrogenase family)